MRLLWLELEYAQKRSEEMVRCIISCFTRFNRCVGWNFSAHVLAEELAANTKRKKEKNNGLYALMKRDSKR